MGDPLWVCTPGFREPEVHHVSLQHNRSFGRLIHTGHYSIALDVTREEGDDGLRSAAERSADGKSLWLDVESSGVGGPTGEDLLRLVSL